MRPSSEPRLFWAGVRPSTQRVALSEANRDEFETESIRAGLQRAGVRVAPRTSWTRGYADSVEGGTGRSQFAPSACFVSVAISRSPGLLY
jgi:hypothetical protein